MLTQERLKELLHYDPETGVFTRLVRTAQQNKAGDTFGDVTDNGYVRICIGPTLYRAHRLAWLYMTGAFPDEEIDHRNGIRDDNRWSNLRAVTRKQNTWNRRTRADSVTGLKCISIRTQVVKETTYKYYCVRIQHESKRVTKLFKMYELDKAIEWRDATLRRLHGDYVCTGGVSESTVEAGTLPIVPSCSN